VARAEEYADLSLEAAEAARSKLPPLPEEDQAAPQEGQETPTEGKTMGREGPPGPLSLEEEPQEEEPSPPSPALDRAKIPEQDLSPLSPPAAEEQPPAAPGPTPLPQTAAVEPPSPRPLTDSASLEPPLPTDPKELYDKGLALYRSKAYPQARRHLVAFLSLYPDHRLAVNAQYWIGETYYSVGEFVLALGAFEAVVQNYPKGSKVPDGMLKIGLTELNLGRKIKAMEHLRECVARFPRSKPASIARRYLARLGG
jgi:tol-pal system protein YbgF